MEYRRLGKSGLRVSTLSFGTVTFGGADHAKAWGSSTPAEAKRLIDICLDAGINLFDTADIYSYGRSEEMLAQALGSRRDEVLISTKATFRMGDDPNNSGSSRAHLIDAVEDSLRRLGRDHIDIYNMHIWDQETPIDEVLHTLDDLVTAGKVRYLAASNYPAWALMKSLAVSDRYGWNRYIAHQVQYSLAVREYEWELGPLGEEEGVGATVWSPLAQGLLTGKVRRGQALPSGARTSGGIPPEVPTELERVYSIVDVLDEISSETGRSMSQVALNWLLAKPTVCSVIVGARVEEQLLDTLGTVEWSLDPAQVERLDEASAPRVPYPYTEYVAPPV